MVDTVILEFFRPFGRFRRGLEVACTLTLATPPAVTF